MFDANMRYLPEDHKAIAVVWGCKEDTVLYKHGVRKGDYIKFTMLEDCNDNPKIVVHLPEGGVVVDSHSEGLFAYHFLYEGTIEEDGTSHDFRNEETLQEVEEFFKEKEL